MLKFRLLVIVIRVNCRKLSVTIELVANMPLRIRKSCKYPPKHVVLLWWLKVESKKFGILANWQREYTMEDILTQLKKEMAAPHNRKLVQPPEGTYF